MTSMLLLTALLVIPAAFLIVIGDEVDPIAHARGIVRKNAKNSGDRSQLRSRLEELGRDSEKEYTDFRIKQYGYSASAISLSLVFLLVTTGKLITATFGSVVVGGIVYVLVDRDLTKAIKKRRELIESEFPAVIEMLTLAIAAGETPMSAMLRVANSAEGELAHEFQIVVAEVRSGIPLNVALDSMGRRVKSVMIRRFVDALITATLRGAPLVEVLSRHAIEARGNQRNQVMAAAGKAEISMMIPVVFLILPISILFALWPSLTNLNMFAS
jgi:tight adherence protein C